MGLIVVFMEVLFSAVLSACMSAKVVKTIHTTYYDCCSPSLRRDAKDGCRVAQQLPEQTVIDENGDKHIFIWSDCEPGKERWREWEK